MQSFDNSQLKLQVRRLQQFESNSTSLISLYVPGTQSQVNLALNNIKHELSVVSNVKSKETRRAVQDALKKLQNKLRTSKFPEQGLAFFAGMDPEGKSECVVVVPPNPVRYFYKCEKNFIVKPLKNMLVQGPLVGVALFDGKSFVVGECQDSRRTIFSKNAVFVPKKHGRGGQSANRFARQRV